MRRLAAILLLLAGAPAFGQGIPLKSGATSDLATVDANKNLRVNEGPSARTTYVASSSALTTTALYSMQIEAGAALGFKLSSFCVGVTNATAAAGVTIAINRRSTASSGGTQLTAEGTGADSVSKMDPAAANFPGVARRTPTLGTVGATLFQTGFQIGELAAGTADPTGLSPFCKQFGENGEQLPTVSAGTSNGISITVSSLGSGALAFGSIAATLIVE